MRTKIMCPNCPETVTSQVRNHWRAREEHFNALLGSAASDAALDLLVNYDAEARRYAVRALLPLALATLTAEALDANIETALDRVADLLADAVRQHRAGGAPDKATSDVDTASADSFPASDSPSWTPVTAVGSKQ